MQAPKGERGTTVYRNASRGMGRALNADERHGKGGEVSPDGKNGDLDTGERGRGRCKDRSRQSDLINQRKKNVHIQSGKLKKGERSEDETNRKEDLQKAPRTISPSPNPQLHDRRINHQDERNEEEPHQTKNRS